MGSQAGPCCGRQELTGCTAHWWTYPHPEPRAQAEEVPSGERGGLRRRQRRRHSERQWSKVQSWNPSEEGAGVWLAAARGRDEIEREGGKQRGSMPRALPLDLRTCPPGSHPWTATSGQVSGSSGEMGHGERVHLSACGLGDGWLPGAPCGWQGASFRLREKWGAMLAVRSRSGVGSGSRALCSRAVH